MKILIFILMLTFSSASFAAEDPQTQKERGLVSFGIFKTVCFMMSAKESWAKRTEFLDSKFTRHTGVQKEAFLKLLQNTDGEVWAAVFPKGVFAIIIEPNGNCHVVAQKADADVIHEKVKELSDEAGKFLTNANVVYNDIKKTDVLGSSGFEVKSKEGGHTLTVVVASTALVPSETRPAAILTTAVSPPSSK